MRFIVITLAALATVTLTEASKADDAPDRSPELQVLDRFVGDWDLVVTSKPAGGETVTRKTRETRKWSLGGKFVRFENTRKGQPEELEFHMLLTCDPATKTYPGVLMSGPSRTLVDGTWDAETKTMTFSGTSANGGHTFVFTNRFIDKDHTDSSGTIKNADGDVVLELTQKQTRHKK